MHADITKSPLSRQLARAAQIAAGADPATIQPEQRRKRGTR